MICTYVLLLNLTLTIIPITLLQFSLSYLVFSTPADGPLSQPSSHHSPSPLPLATPLTTPPHHSYSLLLTPFPITTSHHSPHPSSHQSLHTPLLLITHSHYILSLLPSLPLTTPPLPTPSPLTPHLPLHPSFPPLFKGTS